MSCSCLCFCCRECFGYKSTYAFFTLVAVRLLYNKFTRSRVLTTHARSYCTLQLYSATLGPVMSQRQCHGEKQLDLSPPASCLAARAASCHSSPASCTEAGKTGVLPFDQLVGAESSPEHLFTCGRAYPEVPLAPREYKHTSNPGTTESRGVGPPPPAAPARFDNVAIGMPVAPRWLIGNDDASRRAHARSEHA